MPAIDHALTSSRVLTMEFIDGARVTDGAALKALRVDRRALAAAISETFNEMIFTFGDVHCDPHAANLVGGRGARARCGRGVSTPALPSKLSRKRPLTHTCTHATAQLVRKAPGSGRDQVVLLDHGLYRTIDDAFRARYAALWRALVFGDAAGIKEHAGAMNAGELYPLFAAMLTQRPWDQARGFERVGEGAAAAPRRLLARPPRARARARRGLAGSHPSASPPLQPLHPPLLPRSLTSASTTWRCPRASRTRS